MPIIKDYKKAIRKIKDISSRFDLSKCRKEYLTVERIISDVRLKGDKALIKFSKQFDKAQPTHFRVSKRAINNSTKNISRDVKINSLCCFS